MSYARPSTKHPRLFVNDLGYTRKDYQGAISTLCAGCGHDSISSAIIQACLELNVEPHKVAKMSGIGCSSKSPTYFLSQSHGFNSVHGRMPSVATGAALANRDLLYIGVSGDGDTASIGMGQFAHVIRRQLNMLYIVENNGVYGLTKGQNSATLDFGSKSKKGEENLYEPIDLASVALQLGATFVARSFSGDKKQLVPLLKAAMSHKGFAFIDIVSPCVTFNNHPGSMKSFDYVREHMQQTGKTDFIPMKEEICVEYEPGKTQEVTLHDGSVLHFHKDDGYFDRTSRWEALAEIEKYKQKGEVLTGLLYVEPDASDTHQLLNTNTKPLNSLVDDELCPGSQALKAINGSLR